MAPDPFRNTGEWAVYEKWVAANAVNPAPQGFGQTKLGSFVEAWANIIVGFAINYTANLIVLPWFGYVVTGLIAFKIGLIFTVISLARQYVLRRWFNGLKFGNRR